MELLDTRCWQKFSPLVRNNSVPAPITTIYIIYRSEHFSAAFPIAGYLCVTQPTWFDCPVPYLNHHKLPEKVYPAFQQTVFAYANAANDSLLTDNPFNILSEGKCSEHPMEID